MAYTIDQLVSLEAAIASGALSVRQSDGTTVTYQSLADMRRLRQEMQSEIGVTPAKTRTAVINPTTGRGL